MGVLSFLFSEDEMEDAGCKLVLGRSRTGPWGSSSEVQSTHACGVDLGKYVI